MCNNGRFDPRHLHNWQHAANYPAFFVSGEQLFSLKMCSTMEVWLYVAFVS